jgi:hypothetical protein
MGTRRKLVIFGLVALWAMVVNQAPVAARETSHVCSEACDAVSCDQECWLTQFDFDNEYPSTTCGAESYACCGDGICDAANEPCFNCPDDCTDPPGAECDPECDDPSDCPSQDYTCNGFGQCVPPAPNNEDNGTTCSNRGNCYASDACMASGDCALPWKDECSDNDPCMNTAQCQTRNLDSHVYCNPGNNRCMYTLINGCAPL